MNSPTTAVQVEGLVADHRSSAGDAMNAAYRLCSVDGGRPGGSPVPQAHDIAILELLLHIAQVLQPHHK